jgi:predicted nucleic acid-binding protein
VVIYLHSAAVVKLVHPESESTALARWLSGRTEVPRVTSVLTEVEVPRAILRWAPAASARVGPVLATLYRIEITAAVRAAATAFADPLLRSLDAIHLATALQLGTELAAFLTYDKRLLAAAETAGLPTASPSG